MDESEIELSGMTRPISIVCLPKGFITNALKFTLSSITILSLIYITLLCTHFAIGIELDEIILALGFISLTACLSIPFGFYGALRNSYWALFTFIFVSSYHLYGLLFYLKLYISDTKLIQTTKGGLLGGLALHQTSLASCLIVVVFSMLMTSLALIVKTKLIPPAKVIISDNNPSD